MFMRLKFVDTYVTKNYVTDHSKRVKEAHTSFNVTMMEVRYDIIGRLIALGVRSLNGEAPQKPKFDIDNELLLGDKMSNL